MSRENRRQTGYLDLNRLEHLEHGYQLLIAWFTELYNSATAKAHISKEKRLEAENARQMLQDVIAEREVALYETINEQYLTQE